MSDDVATRDALDRARKVFSLAWDLGQKFQQEIDAGGNSLGEQGMPGVRYRTELAEFTAAIVACRDIITQPPEGLSEVSRYLGDAGKIAQSIQGLEHEEAFGIWALFPELNTIGYSGYQAVKAVVEAMRLDDPFAFLSEVSNENRAATGGATESDPHPEAAVAQPCERTVAWLIAQLGGFEQDDRKAKEQFAKIKRAPTQGSREAHYDTVGRQWRQSANRLLEGIKQCEGADRLQAYCDANDIEWTSKGLKQLRGRLCEQLDCSPAEVDQMTVVVFHQRLRGGLHSIPHDNGGGATAKRRTIEAIEQDTPELDKKSVEWLVARQENKEKLGLPIDTLRNYRLDKQGGRKMPDGMFGVDRDGRRWRRQGTATSAVYYYVPSLPKASKKASN